MNAPEFGYYHVDIAAPATAGRPAYTAECQDIIDALGMTFAEGCAFKAIWRNAAARTLGKVKPGSQGGLYDAKKVAYYGQRMVVAESASFTVCENGRPEVLPLLPLVVGGVYRTREGTTTTIESIDQDENYPVNTWYARSHTVDGLVFIKEQHPGDLVERIA